MIGKPRIALIHDWLVTKGGAEQVASDMGNIWPKTTFFTLVSDPNGSCGKIIEDNEVVNSFLNKIPGAERRYRSFLPLFPFAIEQFDLTDFDIIISSSHAIAKGVLVSPNQLHISYTNATMRYAWDMYHQYLYDANITRGLKSILVRFLMHYIRLWDVTSSNRVDYFIANSHYCAQRLYRLYRRSSTVIYPPVDTSLFAPLDKKENYFIAISRVVPYKKMDMIAEVFSKLPDKQLVIIGDGPDYKKLQSKSEKNVKLLGHQPKDVVHKYLSRARALIHAADDDFGIVPVEAQACGIPVIAYGKGGALETVIDGKTGLFFHEQTVESLLDTIQRFESGVYHFSLDDMRRNAERFSKECFQREIKQFVEQKWDEFQRGLAYDNLP